MSEIYRRFRALDEGERLQEGGKISLIASTDAPIDWGGWREVLSHAEGAIDMSAAKSLLINHDPDQLCGGISDMQVGGGRLISEAEIDEDARMHSGVSVRKMVSKKRLNGVSIGYTYSLSDCTDDPETGTRTVNRWRLLEISLTPIPADKRAQVRAMPDGLLKPIPVPTPVASPATQPTEARMSEAGKETPKSQGQESALNANDISEKARAAAMQESREVAEIARSIGLDPVEFIGKPKAAAQDAMMRALAEKNATKKPEKAITEVHVDAADKARDMFAGALAHNAGFRNAKDTEQNPMRGRKLREMVREYATMIGENTRHWDDRDIAHYGLGRLDLVKGRSGGANTTTSMLSTFVYLNAITKITAMGYSMSESSFQYNKIVSRNTVPDFKQFTIGSLGVGNFSNVSEDSPLPELSKAEGAYNSTAKTWGGTISLTIQAFVGDDTGAFYRTLSNAGSLLNKARDRRTFQKLLMGTSSSEGTSTWTNNTTSGCTPVWTTADTLAAARANVNKGIAAFMGKVGQDGNPLGHLPRFIVAGQTSGGFIAGLLNPSGGQTVSNAYAQNCELVISPWLEASALTGNSTTSYYVLAGTEVTGLVLSEVAGYEGINVDPYDAGASLALKWKLWSPFEVDLVSQANSAGTTIIAAAQQCTT